jgi:hypothetical protein
LTVVHFKPLSVAQQVKNKKSPLRNSNILLHKRDEDIFLSAVPLCLVKVTHFTPHPTMQLLDNGRDRPILLGSAFGLEAQG